MASYLCGIDIGGTFTDCVLVDEKGKVTTAKASSTPGNFAEGLMNALAAAAEKIGSTPAEIARDITMLSHGTTVGTNAIIQKRGVKVGLITTMGHNDVIHIMRGSRGLTGQDIRLVVHIPESKKPDPIVPKRLVEGVSERVDCFGKEIVPLNEDEARESIQRLLDQNVEAIAVCFLWSFLDPSHEMRVRELIEEMAPDMFVTCSNELVPKWGEYERTAAVAFNAYIGPLTTRYIARVEDDVKKIGYANPLQITQCAGGTISVEKAMEAPLLTLDSGPVSGVTGSAYLGDMMGHKNIITTDMGGTSFDVGVIHDGHLFLADATGILQCLKADSGEVVFRERLGGNLWGSILLADEKLYVSSLEGDTFVVKAVPKFELIATNSTGEATYAALAPSNGELFLRTHGHLYCIGR
ncbi:MAG: hypothetical protein HOK61_00130 [Alphaproteobacteria bacterium]|nr:hypothetical protein [Alphaproteobacteria bacterium]